jgi:23S rRNA (cytosine1962-C5)-methyltransferase
VNTVRLRIAASAVRPRLFRKMVRSADRGTAHGDVVRIEDRDGTYVGQGFYNGRSELAVRVLTRVHGETVDEAWVRRKVERAVRLRREVLRLDESTDAYRVFHAEADGLPGLVVDRYGDALSAEVSVLGTYRLMPVLKDALREQLGYRALAVREEARLAKIEGFRIPPPPRDADWRRRIREYDARFEVDLAGGHKTGFFLDQRDNRRAFALLARGRRVLDLCCHAGGFAIHAALAGARSVRAADLDEDAVALARANARRNDVPVEVVHADAFDVLRETKLGAVDAVVLDPPKLVRTRDERSRGLKRYLDLNTLALRALAPGGLLLTCSCSGLVDEPTFLETLRRAGTAADRKLRILRIAGAAPDHPVDPAVPESRYLKAVLAEVG